MSAIEKVVTACPKSPYKDDRHTWKLVMYESGLPGSFSAYPEPRYFLRECTGCKLVVLLRGQTTGSYPDAPRREDTILYAEYEGDKQ